MAMPAGAWGQNASEPTTGAAGGIGCTTAAVGTCGIAATATAGGTLVLTAMGGWDTEEPCAGVSDAGPG